MNSLPENSSSGQALLLVLLTMAVVLTVVLSVVSRTITNIKTTGQEEEATRAFLAAETGVERSLIISRNTSGTIGDATYNAQVVGLSGEPEFTYPYGIYSGESITLWFVNHDENGNLACGVGLPCYRGNRVRICWGAKDTPLDANTPAVEVSVFYLSTPGSYSTARIARGAYDPFVRSNNFLSIDPGECTIGTKTYEFQKVVYFDNTSPHGLGIPSTSYNSDNGLQFARIRMIYNTAVAHEVGISVSGTGGTLPRQGISIQSMGVAGESTRKLEVFQGYGEPPPIFDSVVYSSGGITK